MLSCSPGIILKSIQDLNFYSLENYGIAIYSENMSPYMSLSVSIFPINCWKDIFHWLKEWVKNRYIEIGGKLCQVSLWILVDRWRGNSFFPTVLIVLAVPLGWCCVAQNLLYWAKWLAFVLLITTSWLEDFLIYKLSDLKFFYMKLRLYGVYCWDNNLHSTLLTQLHMCKKQKCAPVISAVASEAVSCCLSIILILSSRIMDRNGICLQSQGLLKNKRR